MPLTFKFETGLEVYCGVGGAVIKKGTSYIDISCEEWNFLVGVFEEEK